MGLQRLGRKVYNKGRKAAKKRYVAKSGGRQSTGGYRVGKMAKDIMYLKSVLNPEKKRSTSSQTTPLLIGQVNGNDDGGHFSDVTPLLFQGVGTADRTGASVKLHSSIWNFQFKQQVGVVADIKLSLEIWAIDKEPYAPATFTFRNEHYDPNSFIALAEIRDYNCQVNPDNFMKGKCIARRRLTIKEDSVGSQSNLTHVKIPILYNKGQGRHIRYRKDTNVLESGQLYLLIRMDRGNIGAPSTITVPDVNINTGLEMMYNRVDYFYDN